MVRLTQKDLEFLRWLDEQPSRGSSPFGHAFMSAVVQQLYPGDPQKMRKTHNRCESLAAADVISKKGAHIRITYAGRQAIS